MNWKKLFLRFLLYAPAIFATILFARMGHHRPNDFIYTAFDSVSLTLGWIGFEEIDKGKEPGVRLFLMDCFFILIVINIVLFGMMIYTKSKLLESVMPYLLYSMGLLSAAPFPVAIYMNRNKNNFISQQASANES
jgi:hypothetical protein